MSKTDTKTGINEQTAAVINEEHRRKKDVGEELKQDEGIREEQSRDPKQCSAKIRTTAQQASPLTTTTNNLQTTWSCKPPLASLQTASSQFSRSSCASPLASNSASSSMPMSLPLSRSSHDEFLTSPLVRDWESVKNYWSDASSIAADIPPLASFMTGGAEYGITALDPIHQIGIDNGEYESRDPRFQRKTFALRVGYSGTMYSGFQKQNISDGVRTVEDDLLLALGRTSTAAGRTDKDVSAVSQILSFHSKDASVTEESIMTAFAASEPARAKRVCLYECKRVPKKFHSLFRATWRRYLYLFPLNQVGDGDGVDVDVPFVDTLFRGLEGKKLDFNAFAFGDLNKSNRGGGGAGAGAASEKEGTDTVCLLHLARAFTVQLASEEQKAMCVELVGSRFLRRMVRNLVSTAIRESTKAPEDRAVSALYDIATKGDRANAAHPVPGVGLALCGVGYDIKELSENAFVKKRQQHYNGLFSQEEEEEEEEAEEEEAAEAAEAAAAAEEEEEAEEEENEEEVEVGREGGGREEDESSRLPTSKHSLESESWKLFEAELSSAHSELIYFPQRAFEQFKHHQEHILLDQATALGVGSTVWDAEILLAYFLDSKNIGKKNESILELGAGTALAAISCFKRNKDCRLVVQELDGVLAHTIRCLELNDCASSISAVACRWGSSEAVPLLLTDRGNKFDFVIAADVLYYEKEFPSLLETIFGCLKPGGSVFLSVEQRRRNISPFCDVDLASRFEHHEEVKYTIPLVDDPTRITKFSLHVYKNFQAA